MYSQRHIEHAKIMEKISYLELDIKSLLTQQQGVRSKTIQQCKNLFSKTTQLMKSSERKLGQLHYPDEYPMSPKLKHAAENLIKVKAKLRETSINDSKDDSARQLLQQELKECYKKLRETQKKAVDLRKEFLMDLAHKKAQEWNLESSQAAIIIEAAEESKELHKRH